MSRHRLQGRLTPAPWRHRMATACPDFSGSEGEQAKSHDGAERVQWPQPRNRSPTSRRTMNAPNQTAGTSMAARERRAASDSTNKSPTPQPPRMRRAPAQGRSGPPRRRRGTRERAEPFDLRHGSDGLGRERDASCPRRLTAAPSTVDCAGRVPGRSTDVALKGPASPPKLSSKRVALSRKTLSARPRGTHLMTAVKAHNARRVQALRAVLDLKGKSERERMLALIATLESGRMVDGERPFDAPARRAQ